MSDFIKNELLTTTPLHHYLNVTQDLLDKFYASNASIGYKQLITKTFPDLFYIRNMQLKDLIILCKQLCPEKYSTGIRKRKVSLDVLHTFLELFHPFLEKRKWYNPKLSVTLMVHKNIVYGCTVSQVKSDKQYYLLQLPEIGSI